MGTDISNCEVILGKVGGHFPPFPLCFLLPAPTQYLFTFPFSSTLHLSHIFSDMAWCDFDRDEGVVGNALRLEFHWKEECIMPYGEESTNTFWLYKASSDLAQNILCPTFFKLTITMLPWHRHANLWLHIRASEAALSQLQQLIDQDSVKTHVLG